MFQLEIPLDKVISITREKLALIIPNAIGIQIADQKVSLHADITSKYFKYRFEL